jgi:hypothetical protein
MGWTGRGSKAGGFQTFFIISDKAWDPPNILHAVYRTCFPVVKRPGMALTT